MSPVLSGSPVLVTGATGLVGAAVAHELSARGAALRVFARATSDVSRLPPGAAVSRGELGDAAALEAALRGCDAVVHVAGIATIGQHGLAELSAINVAGVEAVLGAAVRAGVRRAVVTSSTAAMGGSSAPDVRDEAAVGNAEALGIPYFVSKLHGERAALAFGARGLEVVALRPAYVLGPGDVHGSSASTVLAFARGRIPAWVEGGASFCDVRDVAAAHAEAILRGRPGEAYLLGGHNLRMSEFVPRVCALAGVKPPPRVPFPVAWAAAGLQELGAKVTGRRAAMTRDLARAAALYTFVSSAKAERELGYRVRPLEEILRDTLDDFRARGKLKG